MNDYGRISRRERRRRRPSTKSLVAAGLAVVVAGLAIVSLGRQGSRKQVKDQDRPVAGSINLQTVADSLVITACRSFGLTDTARVDSLLAQKLGAVGPRYHRFRQVWPADLPPIIYAQRLSGMSAQKQISCDCLESPKAGWLDCTLRAGNSVGASVILDPSRRAKLAGREVALIFDNLGYLREKDIADFLSSGLVFSYFATADVFPTADIRNLLSRNEVAAVLRLPANKGGWQKLVRPTPSKGGRKPAGQLVFDSSLIDEVFRRHPTARAVCFDGNGPAEKPVVSAILDKARREQIAYLYTDAVPSFVDSLAYAKGLAIVRLNTDHDMRTASAREFRFNLLATLLSAEGPHRVVIRLDAGRVNPAELLALKVTCDRLGVKFSSCMELTETVEEL